MIEVGIFIIPKIEISEKVLKWKKIIEQNFGEQLYLSHFPHITLSNFYTNNVDRVETELSKYCKNFNKNLTIKINGTNEFINDPLTNGSTLYFVVERNTEILKFQYEIMKNIEQLIKTKFSSNFEDANYNSNNEKYKYPFVGKDWIPHISICSLSEEHSKSEVVNTFLSQNIDYSFNIDSIYLYKITNNSHTKIAEIRLTNG
tara:strand:+ start:21919 stop:22524 length:606 start_codon:yes stop_codon:yes gene_type:complete